MYSAVNCSFSLIQLIHSVSFLLYELLKIILNILIKSLNQTI